MRLIETANTALSLGSVVLDTIRVKAKRDTIRTNRDNIKALERKSAYLIVVECMRLMS